jgi:hypothetical protein
VTRRAGVCGEEAELHVFLASIWSNDVATRCPASSLLCSLWRRSQSERTLRPLCTPGRFISRTSEHTLVTFCTESIRRYFLGEFKSGTTTLTNQCFERNSQWKHFLMQHILKNTGCNSSVTYHLAPALRQAVQATASLACRHHQDVRPLDAPAHRRDRSFQFVVSEMKTVCVTTKPVRDALCSLQAPLYFVRDDSGDVSTQLFPVGHRALAVFALHSPLTSNSQFESNLRPRGVVPESFTQSTLSRANILVKSH